MKEYLIDLYITFFEKVYESNNKDLMNKIWQKLKTNTSLLEYAITINKNNFKSASIAYKILKDKTLYNTNIYKKLIETIYSKEIIARQKPNHSADTFLFLSLENTNLELTKHQKQFLIFEAEKCPYTENYYKEQLLNETSIHGAGLTDIRYRILQNSSFTIQEKTNLFLFFYPDIELKIAILDELEWEIAKKLGIANEKEYCGIYLLNENDIKEKIKEEQQSKEIYDKIILCKYIQTKIPKEEIKKYRNND